MQFESKPSEKYWSSGKFILLWLYETALPVHILFAATCLLYASQVLALLRQLRGNQEIT